MTTYADVARRNALRPVKGRAYSEEQIETMRAREIRVFGKQRDRRIFNDGSVGLPRFVYWHRAEAYNEDQSFIESGPGRAETFAEIFDMAIDHDFPGALITLTILDRDHPGFQAARTKVEADARARDEAAMAREDAAMAEDGQ